MGCIGSKLRGSTTRSGVEASSSAEKMKTVATKKFPDESAALSQKSSVLTNKSSLSCWSSEVSERSASSRAKNKAEFDQLIATEKNLIVVDFFATWCGPCKAIAPHLAKWAEEYDDVTFIKIDVDENEDTAEACGISAMPTFHFYKNGKKVDEIVGANHEKIKEKILALK
ncbi:uncharacterized protein LOC131949283 isoform X2 [Physella acuta]|uniref:uncharacterized protein LOC131949283 isoform X2 n=2 Tax=Physella acuta TaxID=109671 RepID=UPI0027DCCBF6|nr:uncharacterized protein LOC131949283 isoform X2 [Physella acuta]